MKEDFNSVKCLNECILLQIKSTLISTSKYLTNDSSSLGSVLVKNIYFSEEILHFKNINFHLEVNIGYD